MQNNKDKCSFAFIKTKLQYVEVCFKKDFRLLNFAP